MQQNIIALQINVLDHLQEIVPQVLELQQQKLGHKLQLVKRNRLIHASYLKTKMRKKKKKSNTRQPSVKKDDRQSVFSTTHRDNLLSNIHNLLTPNSMDARSNQALCKSKSTFQSPISQGIHKQSFPPKKVEPPKCRAGTALGNICLLYTSPSPRDLSTSRMPSSA
eukprot:TRINITY_DN3410_c0_g3_i1.p1 TRINITY_DN3410_c0_g3~~TRINITY_DN3410_c0_g3_i1.p1  ORF type:complete len:166 (+),score=34.57 TRINITY_DN3410_c0_g3_i1:189-686(+)